MYLYNTMWNFKDPTMDPEWERSTRNSRRFVVIAFAPSYIILIWLLIRVLFF